MFIWVTGGVEQRERLIAIKATFPETFARKCDHVLKNINWARGGLIHK